MLYLLVLSCSSLSRVPCLSYTQNCCRNKGPRAWMSFQLSSRWGTWPGDLPWALDPSSYRTVTLWSCYTSKEVLVEGKVLESSGVCVQDWLGVRSQREGHPVPGVAVTWVSGYPWGTGWVQGEEEALGQDASALGESWEGPVFLKWFFSTKGRHQVLLVWASSSWLLQSAPKSSMFLNLLPPLSSIFPSAF